MDMQQMMQQLLDKLEANQEKTEASMKSNKDLLTRMKSDQEQMLAEISARMEANTKEMNVTQEI
jgi:hypothetical protein